MKPDGPFEGCVASMYPMQKKSPHLQAIKN
jgi:hypothetical protein